MNGDNTASKGFTLIEIIVVIVLLGVVAVMAGSFFSRSVSKSVDPITNLQNEVSLQSWMEKIVYQYEYVSPGDLAALYTYMKNNAPGNYINDDTAPYYAKMDSSNTVVPDASGNNNLLKITIKSTTTSEQLTVLFSKQ